MLDFKPVSHPIRTARDIAKFLGLNPRSDHEAISSAFVRATRCEALLRLEEEILTEMRSETWEARIIQAQPECRILLRQDGRGCWQDDPALVPDEVIRAFHARVGRDGRLVSARSWKLWVKTCRSPEKWRQLRSRSGEIHLVKDVADICRQTGERRASIVIEPLGAPCPDAIAPVRLALPTTPSMIKRQVAAIRSASEAQMAFA